MLKQKERRLETQLNLNENNGTYTNTTLTNQESSYSVYFDEYYTFFEKIPVKAITQFEDNLIKDKINWNPNQFVYPPRFSFVTESNNFAIVVLQISLSYFSFKIEILNLNQPSIPEALLHRIGKGSFSKVYRIKDENGNQYVVKHADYNESAAKKYITKTPKIVHLILGELCFYKLLSSLEIGPLYKKYLGFDCVTFTNGIQFAVEYCTPVDLTKSLDVCSSLKLLHTLKIIHGDFKKQNLVYSPHWQKNVLIDFNCSKVIKQKIGQKTLTRFHGTHGSVSPEMKNLQSTEDFSFIDEYYNDFYGFKSVFPKLEKKLIQTPYQQNFFSRFINQESEIDFKCDRSVSVFYLLINLQYYIYQRNISIIRDILNQIKLLYSIKRTNRNRINSCEKIRIQQRKASDASYSNSKGVWIKFPEKNLIEKEFFQNEKNKKNMTKLKIQEMKKQSLIEKYIYQAMAIFLQIPITQELKHIQNLVFSSLSLQLSSNLDFIDIIQQEENILQNSHLLLAKIDSLYHQRKLLLPAFPKKRKLLEQRYSQLTEYCQNFEHSHSTVLFNLYQYVINHRNSDFEQFQEGDIHSLKKLLKSLRKDVDHEKIVRQTKKKENVQNTFSQQQFMKIYYQILNHRDSVNSSISEAVSLFEQKFPDTLSQIIKQLQYYQKPTQKSETIKKIKLIDFRFKKYDKILAKQCKLEDKYQYEMQYDDDKKSQVTLTLIANILWAYSEDKKQKVKVMAYIPKNISNQIKLYQWLSLKLNQLRKANFNNNFISQVIKANEELKLFNQDETSQEIKHFLHYFQVIAKYKERQYYQAQKLCSQIIDWFYSRNFKQNLFIYSIFLLVSRICILTFKIKKASSLVHHILENNLKFYRLKYIEVHIMKKIIQINHITKLMLTDKNQLQHYNQIKMNTEDLILFIRELFELEQQKQDQIIRSILNFQISLQDSQQVFQSDIKQIIFHKYISEKFKTRIKVYLCSVSTLTYLLQKIEFFSNVFSKDQVQKIIQFIKFQKQRKDLNQELLQKIQKVDLYLQFFCLQRNLKKNYFSNPNPNIQLITQNLKNYVDKLKGLSLNEYDITEEIINKYYTRSKFMILLWPKKNKEVISDQASQNQEAVRQLVKQQIYKNVDKGILRKQIQRLRLQLYQINEIFCANIYDTLYKKINDSKFDTTFFHCKGNEIAFLFISQRGKIQQLILIWVNICQRIKMLSNNPIHFQLYLKCMAVTCLYRLFNFDYEQCYKIYFSLATYPNTINQLKSNQEKQHHYKLNSEYVILLYHAIQMVIYYFPDKLDDIVKNTKILSHLYFYLKYCSCFLKYRIKIDCYYYLGKVKAVINKNLNNFNKQLFIRQFRQSQYRQYCDYYNEVSKLLNSIKLKTKLIEVLLAFNRIHSVKMVNQIKYQQNHSGDQHYTEILKMCRNKVKDKLRKYQENKKMDFQFKQRCDISLMDQRFFLKLINVHRFQDIHQTCTYLDFQSRKKKN